MESSFPRPNINTASRSIAYILHHGENHPKLCVFTSPNDDSRSVTLDQHRTPDKNDLDVPLRTNVPMKAIQCLSPKAFPPPSPCVSSPSPRSHCSVFFLAGLVSPVNADSSISSDTAVISRISAGIRSPTENVTRSPGNKVLARGVRG